MPSIQGLFGALRRCFSENTPITIQNKWEIGDSVNHPAPGCKISTSLIDNAFYRKLPYAQHRVPPSPSIAKHQPDLFAHDCLVLKLRVSKTKPTLNEFKRSSLKTRPHPSRYMLQDMGCPRDLLTL
jgi:hypothetical protein